MTLLIRNISQLVTLAGEPEPRRGAHLSEPAVVERAAVLIDDGRIIALGPEPEVVKLPKTQTARSVDAGNCAVLPGFCDSHTHPVFARPRIDEYELRIKGATYQQIAEQGGGIRSSVRSVREASEEQLLRVALGHAALFLAHGTTTIEAKSGYGLDLDSELKLLRVIAQVSEHSALETVPTFLGAHQIPWEYRHDRAAYVRLLCDRMLPAVADSGLAVFCDVYCEHTAFTVEEARRILETASRLGLRAKLHADQFSASGAAQLGVELGAISVDHLEQADETTIRALAGSQTTATLLPGSVFHLGLNRYPPARALIDAGAAVALATDFNPGSSPTVSMQMILSLACDSLRMTPTEAVMASTFNGACALGRSQLVGSIEVGKQADLMITTVPDFRLIPYHFGMNHCRQVVKKGQVVWRAL